MIVYEINRLPWPESVKAVKVGPTAVFFLSWKRILISHAHFPGGQHCNLSLDAPIANTGQSRREREGESNMKSFKICNTV